MASGQPLCQFGPVMRPAAIDDRALLSIMITCEHTAEKRYIFGKSAVSPFVLSNGQANKLWLRPYQQQFQ